MTAHPLPSAPPVGETMLCAAVLTAQFVAGRAARDAIYLAQLDVSSLPQIVIATAAVSIALVAASSMTLRRVSPATFVPLTFVLSALLFVAEWALATAAPALVARVVYLHVSGLGPMLASGFWLIATERFDPRTAKNQFSRIAGVGTLGGLVGALIAERVAARLDVLTVLLILAALNLICAWQVRRIARALDDATPAAIADVAPELSAEPARAGLQALAATPHLRHLAALVLLGTMAAALVDYVFKAEAVAAFGRGDALLRFFAAFYAVTTLMTFVLQTSAGRVLLGRFGLATATATPSAALLIGGTGALLFPGLPAIVVARGGESVFRGSLFRAGYEVFYTPLPPSEKRAAKSIIDVGADRAGEATGGIAISLVQMVTSQPYVALYGLAIAGSALALVVTTRLSRGYVRMLERSLMSRAVELDLSEVQDFATRSTMFKVLESQRWTAGTLSSFGTSGTFGTPGGLDTAGILSTPGNPNPRGLADAASSSVTLGTLTTPGAVVRRTPGSAGSQSTAGAPATPGTPGTLDSDVHQIIELRSRDPQRVTSALESAEQLPAALVAHVIPLLAWDAVARYAVRALRRVAEERVGELTDTLIDPNQPFAVRRRIPRVLSICVSQRAADGLMLGLDDLRFEVRYRCGRALAAILDRNLHVRLDPERVYGAVHREVTVSRPVWQSRSLLDRLEDYRGERSFVDQFVVNRASQSLEHVFTLLSLVLPAEPLKVAFRGLHTDDLRLRGTALEYLECVPPAPVRERLWPFLEASRVPDARVRPREEVLDDLLRSNQSIILNLEELRRRDPRRTRPVESR